MRSKSRPAILSVTSTHTVKPYGRTTSRSGKYSFVALCPSCAGNGKRTTILATREEPERTCHICGHRLAVEVPAS
jgi:hypothetical protein